MWGKSLLTSLYGYFGDGIISTHNKRTFAKMLEQKVFPGMPKEDKDLAKSPETQALKNTVAIMRKTELS